jgi:fatty acid desaturase
MILHKPFRSVEWPTLLMLAATYVLWAFATSVLWGWSPVLAVVLTGVAIAQHSSLQHEALHGHPFANDHVNHALVFVPLGLAFPYMRFRDTHLAHHHDPNLTDPYDDPESNYQDPAVWARMGWLSKLVLRANNTLLGRIVLGPVVGATLFYYNDLRAVLQGQKGIVPAYGLHGAGLVLLAMWWAIGPGEMSFGGYLLAAWVGAGLLKIRTYLEHRAHEAFRARTVIIEDRGPLALLFLNNNLHVVHHMHPKVPWYDLPGLYRSNRDHYLRRNDGYVYRSYGQIFLSYLLRAKDPVPHPVWPVRKSD